MNFMEDKNVCPYIGLASLDEVLSSCTCQKVERTLIIKQIPTYRGNM